MRSVHSNKHRMSSAQIMATMRNWPNVSAASVGRGQPIKAADVKDGAGEVFARDVRLALAAAASRNVTVTYRKRRRVAA